MDIPSHSISSCNVLASIGEEEPESHYPSHGEGRQSRLHDIADTSEELRMASSRLCSETADVGSSIERCDDIPTITPNDQRPAEAGESSEYRDCTKNYSTDDTSEDIGLTKECDPKEDVNQDSFSTESPLEEGNNSEREKRTMQSVEQRGLPVSDKERGVGEQASPVVCNEEAAVSGDVGGAGGLAAVEGSAPQLQDSLSCRQRRVAQRARLTLSAGE